MCFILLSCQKGEEPLLQPLTLNEVSGQRVWNRISVDSNYKNYAFWPGHEGTRPGQSPHGAFHNIYVNRTLFDALPLKNGSAPDGSIIVKDGMTAAGSMSAITVMAKVSGFSPENGDWFWVRYSADGIVQAEGALAACIQCHEGMASNDYVIVRRLDEPLP